jgi:hypothetical protein
MFSRADFTWALALVPFVSAGAGAYFGGYLKKKGENLATHEDLEDLVTEMKAVTRATKEIEAKISSEVWDRQKHWEIRREILFEAIRRLAELEDALLALDAYVQVEISEGKKDTDHGWLELKLERKVRWSKATAAFDETLVFVGTLCKPETLKAFSDLNLPLKKIGQKLSVDRDRAVFLSSYPERERLHARVRNAIRDELVRTDINPQPSRSPAAPSLGPQGSEVRS